MCAKRVQLAFVLFVALALSSAGFAHGAEDIDELAAYSSDEQMAFCFDYVQTMDDWSAYELSFEIIKSALNASSKADKEGKAAKLLSNKHNLTLLAPTDDAMAKIVADLGMKPEDLKDGKKVAKLVDTLIVPLAVIEDVDALEKMVEDLTKYNVTLVTDYSVAYYEALANYTYDYADPAYDLMNITDYEMYGDYNGSDYVTDYAADYNFTQESYIEVDEYPEYNLTYAVDYEEYNLTYAADYEEYNLTYAGYGADYSYDTAPLFMTTCSNGYVVPLSAADVVLPK